MNILKKISLGLTGTLKQILIIFLTLLGFSIIGLTLSFPLWYFSIEARGVFNIFMLLVTLAGGGYMVIIRIKASTSKEITGNLKKIAMIFLDLMIALLPFFLYAMNRGVLVYIAPFLILGSLALNRLLKKRFKFASGFCFLIIFIDFLALVYNGAWAIKVASGWLVPVLLITLIPCFGFFLYENRPRSQEN